MSAINPREGWPPPQEPEPKPEVPQEGVRAVMFDAIGLPLQVFGCLLALGLLHVSGGDRFSRLVGTVIIIVANTGGLSLGIPLIGVSEPAFAIWTILMRFFRLLLPVALVIAGVDLFGRVW